MKLPWQQRARGERDDKLAAAEQAVEQLIARADRITPYIEHRRRRNHITEAVETAIYKKHGRPA